MTYSIRCSYRGILLTSVERPLRLLIFDCIIERTSHVNENTNHDYLDCLKQCAVSHAQNCHARHANACANAPCLSLNREEIDIIKHNWLHRQYNYKTQIIHCKRYCEYFFGIGVENDLELLI